MSTAILARPECAWITRELEQKAQGHAIAHVVPEHLQEVRTRKVELIDKTEAAVKDRLTKEISYWDHRAEKLKLQEQAGKPNARLNSQRGAQAGRRPASPPAEAHGASWSRKRQISAAAACGTGRRARRADGAARPDDRPPTGRHP